MNMLSPGDHGQEPGKPLSQPRQSLPTEETKTEAPVRKDKRPAKKKTPKKGKPRVKRSSVVTGNRNQKAKGGRSR
jgi:hypothetical protein